PPAVLQQQLVAEQVGERRVAALAEAFLVREDALPRQDLAGVAEDDTLGRVLDRVVDVEVVFVAVGNERLQTQHLEQRQPIPQPETLADGWHWAGRPGAGRVRRLGGQARRAGQS